jgi:glyoxylase-like metal-dependent hydrolase (beta-lactamase superfamily II)
MSMKQAVKNEVILINGNSYFYNSILSIGVILIPDKSCALLIDSGLDESAAKKIKTFLAAKNIAIKYVINTHSHADHCGGNAWLQKGISDLKIYAPPFEATFIKDPSLELFVFSAGAAPFAELDNKFLKASPSSITGEIEYKDHLLKVIEGIELDIVILPGHTPGMIGVGYIKDKVFYCGDSIFGSTTLDKHGVLFYTDISKTLESMQKLLGLIQKYDNFVLYHGGVVSSSQMKDIIEKNKERLINTTTFILETIKKSSLSIEKLMQEVMCKFQVDNNVVQYTLTRTCVLAHLRKLQQQKEITLSVKDGVLMLDVVSSDVHTNVK